MKNLIFILALVMIAFNSILIFGQQTCPPNFIVPIDSDVSNPNCGDINIDDGVIILNTDPCTVDFTVALDLDIPMSTIVTDNVFFDVNLVDANLGYQNMLCFDNIHTIQFAGGLQEGTECGIDKSFFIMVILLP